jgi:hypothetical protein
MELSRSAKFFLERKDLIPTLRGPLPRLALDLNAVQHFPVSAPLPNPNLLVAGRNSDQGRTEIWPHGVESETLQ